MLFGSIETYAERVRRAEQSLFGSTQRFALSWAPRTPSRFGTENFLKKYMYGYII